MDDDLFGAFNAPAAVTSAPTRPKGGVKRARIASIDEQSGETIIKGSAKAAKSESNSAPSRTQATDTTEQSTQPDSQAADATPASDDEVDGTKLGPTSKATVTAVSRPAQADDSSVGAAASGTGDDGASQEGTHTKRAPAKEYPFVLDPFQAQSVAALEANESVLVSAHTSAGKTVVAEYAIAMALRDNQRVIYTSPIKALSNQKYRDLYEEFSDVGLMTGDVTINPGASCLVMTTEILRSMLYRGSEVVREVKWVIYDEIHYMRDKERGVVWEESIVMLPNTVRFVFLSATIPNASEFADWIATVKHQTCHVVHTEYRPTPLQHYLFPSGGEGVYLVVDDKGRFREDNFSKAMAQLTDGADDPAAQALMEGGKGGKKKGKGKKSGGKDAQGDLFLVVKMIMERKYDPVIVFSFSKRECEAYALQLSKLDFTSDEEKALIEKVFSNAIASLSEDDRKLPQVHAILPLLKRGVGIHHGGLLPILKEVIEILFGESLIKILLATETFAMGINMPAKTVIFTSITKFDGEQTRNVSAGEYIQMSGRAGRRGLDSRGIVIQMIGQKMEPADAKALLQGKADPLNSSFHLGYNMLLNLMRVEDADPTRIMSKSFHQFQNERAAPQIEEKIKELTDSMQSGEGGVPEAQAEAVAEYFTLGAQMEQLAASQRRIVTQPKHCLKFLQPGRLMQVKDGEADWGWGVLVNYNRSAPGGGRRAKAATGSVADASADEIVCDMLLLCAPAGDMSSGAAAAANRKTKPEPCPEAVAARGGGDLRTVPVLLSAVHGMSAVRLFLPKDVRSPRVRNELRRKLTEVHARFPGGVPLLDPMTDMHIDDGTLTDVVAGMKAAKKRQAQSSLAELPAEERESLLETHEAQLSKTSQIKYLKKVLSESRSLVMKDTLKRMQRVLRRLGHVDTDGVVQLKGRVAAEVNTADELVVTELIFNGTFNELEPPQVAALLSCLVFTERGEGTGEGLPEALSKPLRMLQEAARRVATVSVDAKLDVDVEEYVEHFRPDMMEVVFAWTKGSKFVDICGMTKVFEGTVIRVIRRLEELLRQLADAAAGVGETSLQAKFLAAAKSIRRDIIFAASLYL